MFMMSYFFIRTFPIYVNVNPYVIFSLVCKKMVSLKL